MKEGQPRAQQGKRALYGLFVLAGVAMATLVTRMPALRDALDASTEQMGLVLFGLSLGSMGGILSAHAITQWLHAHRAVGLGTALVLLGWGVVAGGALWGSPWLVFAGFVLFGVGMGWADIGMNVECAALERCLQTTLMTTLHGCFSLGTLVGALLGMAVVQAGASLGMHWGVVLLGAVLTMFPLVGHIPNLSARPQQPEAVVAPAAPAARPSLWAAYRQRRVLRIGLFVLAMALAEGAANDWLTLLMVDSHGFDQGQGALIFLLFTLGMVLGRFSGHRLLQRFERAALMRASALAAVGALALVIFAPHPWLAAAATLFWGLGASLGFPLALSAAGEGPEADSARNVAAAATLGYVAFLVGPPLLGFLGEHFGLRMALLPVLVMAVAAVIVAPVFRKH